MPLIGAGETYQTVSDGSAEKAAQAWATYYRDTADVLMPLALASIQRQAVDAEFRLSSAAAAAYAAQNAGLTHGGLGLLFELFCTKDEHGNESAACGIARNQGQKTVDNTIDYASASAHYWSTRDEFAHTVSNVATVLDNSGGSGMARIGLSFHPCCLRQESQNFPYDLLEIDNASTQDLVTAIIRIRVIGQDGDYVDVWHYRDRLPAGQSVYTDYHAATGFIGRRTVPDVARIEARVWSPYTQPQTFTLAYAGPERERDIAGFVGTLTATVNKYVPPDNAGRGGVDVSFSRHVYSPYDIYIRFQNPSETCGLSEHWSDWTTDSPWPFRSTALSCYAQDIFVYIKFDGSSEWYPIGHATMR